MKFMAQRGRLPSLRDGHLAGCAFLLRCGSPHRVFRQGNPTGSTRFGKSGEGEWASSARHLHLDEAASQARRPTPGRGHEPRVQKRPHGNPRRHPNVARSTLSKLPDGYYYWSGVNRRITREAWLSVRAAARGAGPGPRTQILCRPAQIHAQGIVHRDIATATYGQEVGRASTRNHRPRSQTGRGGEPQMTGPYVRREAQVLLPDSGVDLLRPTVDERSDSTPSASSLREVTGKAPFESPTPEGISESPNAASPAPHLAVPDSIGRTWRSRQGSPSESGGGDFGCRQFSEALDRLTPYATTVCKTRDRLLEKPGAAATFLVFAGVALPWPRPRSSPCESEPAGAPAHRRLHTHFGLSASNRDGFRRARGDRAADRRHSSRAGCGSRPDTIGSHTCSNRRRNAGPEVGRHFPRTEHVPHSRRIPAGRL